MLFNVLMIRALRLNNPTRVKSAHPMGKVFAGKSKEPRRSQRTKSWSLWHGVVQFDFKYLEYMGTARLFKCGCWCCCVCCFDLYSFYSVFLLANSAAFYNVFFLPFFHIFSPSQTLIGLFCFFSFYFYSWAGPGCLTGCFGPFSYTHLVQHKFLYCSWGTLRKS